MKYEILLITAFLFLLSCRKKDDENNDPANVISEVTVIHPERTDIAESIRLNGVTAFQKEDPVRAVSSGYITQAGYTIGSAIAKGAEFCSIRTKEYEALKNIPDSSVRVFAAPIKVYASASGIVTEVFVQDNSYVNEGDVMAVISEPSSLVVRVNVPYEYHAAIANQCRVILPDSTSFAASISLIMPAVDSASQTQTYIIRLPSYHLPENLNVIVEIPVRKKPGALAVNKSAVQANETQQKFWVMKIVNDSMAVHVPVQTGLQNDSLIEILSGNISAEDQIVLEGAYGLADSAKVRIKK